MVTMIAFSYFTNEGLKGKLHLQTRNRYQSSVLWVLLVLNKIIIESKDMEWNSISLIIIYGLLAVCEITNMENPQISHLIISADSGSTGLVILSESNLSEIESYDSATFANFIQHIIRNKDSKKLIFMLL